MPLAVLLAIALEVLSQTSRDQPAAATGGAIEGLVTIQDAKSPSPVRRARVTLTGGILSQPEIADTDPDGRYRFTVAAGSYRVTVGKPGFVTNTAIEVDVKAGETATANVTLSRGAAIEGRLQNDAGEPVAGATVSAVRFRQTTTGWERLLVRQALSDDQGRYRLHSIASGEFFLEAKPDPFRDDEVFLPREERPAPLALTFFPGTVQMHEARPVGLAPGQEVSGIDLVVLRVPAAIKTGAALPFRPASPDPPPQARTSASGRISGRVVAMNTGKPIRFATVMMTSQQGRQSTAQTDAQGRYEFTGLTAGTYRLDASARRYQRILLDGQPYSPSSAAIPRGITLGDAEQFDAADFSMSRGGAIDVRLVDEFGDPAPGLRVQLSRVIYSAGRRRWTPLEAGMNPTDDRGYVRFSGLAPGSYYVSALSGALASGQAGTNGFAPTHYPGTPDPSAAMPVSLALEQQLSISFQLAPARLARLTGKILDPSGAVANASVTLRSADRAGLSGFITLSAKSDADGSFRFRAIPPGIYMLQAYVVVGIPSESNLAAAQFGWLSVPVDGTDQQDLTLRVATGRSLKGRVVSDDPSGVAFNPRDVSVTARAVEFDFAPTNGGPPPFSIEDDGAFEVKNLSGYRLIRVSVRNPGWMLQRVTRLGSDITDEVIDFTKDDFDDVEVFLTNRVTSISGRVTDEKANAVNACSVVVFPRDRAKWGEHSRFIKLATTSYDGSFSVRALPPEDYFAIAIPATQLTPWQDPDFLRALEQSATRFLLGDGEAKNLTLRLFR